MVAIIWTSSAIKELDSIVEYIGIDSFNAAKKFTREIISKAEGLTNQRLRGRPIPEKIPGGYRQILHKSYRIIYRIEGLHI